MNKMHYIIVADGSSYRPMFEHMLQDLVEQEDVSVIVDEPKHIKVKELLLKNKVQKLSGGCLDFLAYERNVLYSCLEKTCATNEKVFVIFLNAALWYNPYMAATLRSYKRRWQNIKYVLFYLDTIDAGVSRSANYLREKGVFDLIYSFDRKNADQYGLEFWNTVYSPNTNNRNIVPQRDVYFCCGVSGKRIPIIESCLTQCQSNGVNCKMDLVCYEETPTLKKFQKIATLLTPDQVLNYSEVLRRELDARCLLEIVAPGRSGLTLRPYEAVVYNRKLLTNNKSILDFKYYNPAYMQYFEKVEDIDWQWVKDQTPVDYDYKGDFSPALLLKDISTRLEQR